MGKMMILVVLVGLLIAAVVLSEGEQKLQLPKAFINGEGLAGAR